MEPIKTPTPYAVGSYQESVALGTPGSNARSSVAQAPQAAPVPAPIPAPVQAPAQPPVITASSLNTPVTPIKLPEPANTASNAASSAMGTAQGTNDALLADLEKQAAAIKETATQDKSVLKGYVDKFLGRSQAQQSAEDALGVGSLKSLASNLTQEYQTKQLAYNSQAQAIANDSSLSSDQRARQLAAVANDHAYQMTDLSIRQNIAAGNYLAAQELVDKKINIEYGDLKDLINFQEKVLSDEQANLSDKEKTKLNILLDENKRKLDEATYQEHALQAAKTELIKSAASQNAPASVQAAIQAAKTPEEATQAAGQYAVDQLDRQVKLANIAQSNASIALSAANIRKINSDIQADKPLDVANIINDPNAPAETKNSAVLTALLKSSKVGDATRAQIGNVLGVINAAQDLASQRIDGKFKGISPINSVLDAKIPFTNIGLPFRNALTSKEGTQNRQYLEAINLATQTWASGASLTEQQTEQVNKFTPRPNDTDEKVREKTNGLVNYMLTNVQSKLQSAGVDYKPEKVNLFETAELLDKASPEQIKELKAQGLIQ